MIKTHLTPSLHNLQQQVSIRAARGLLKCVGQLAAVPLLIHVLDKDEVSWVRVVVNAHQPGNQAVVVGFETLHTVLQQLCVALCFVAGAVQGVSYCIAL